MDHAAAVAVILVMATTVLIVVIELSYRIWHLPGPSVSELTLELLSRYPIIGILWGVTLGHFVWPQYR